VVVLGEFKVSVPCRCRAAGEVWRPPPPRSYAVTRNRYRRGNGGDNSGLQTLLAVRCRTRCSTNARCWPRARQLSLPTPRLVMPLTKPCGGEQGSELLPGYWKHAVGHTAGSCAGKVDIQRPPGWRCCGPGQARRLGIASAKLWPGGPFQEQH